MKTTVRTLTFSTNYVPPSPFVSKSGGGGHDPPSSYGSAAPAHDAEVKFLLVFLLPYRIYGEMKLCKFGNLAYRQHSRLLRSSRLSSFRL